ncbi:hypothetical protein PT2222_300077 [Paraburkholderia tropica]
MAAADVAGERRHYALGYRCVDIGIAVESRCGGLGAQRPTGRGHCTDRPAGCAELGDAGKELGGDSQCPATSRQGRPCTLRKTGRIGQ